MWVGVFFWIQCILAICGADTPRPIPIKFGMRVVPRNVINVSNFCNKILRGFRSTGGQSPRFPIDFVGHRYNSAALPRSLWLLLDYITEPLITVRATDEHWQLRLIFTTVIGTGILHIKHLPCTNLLLCLPYIHCESKKLGHFYFYFNFGKCWSIFFTFFQCRNQKEMAHNKNEKFPTVA